MLLIWYLLFVKLSKILHKEVLKYHFYNTNKHFLNNIFIYLPQPANYGYYSESYLRKVLKFSTKYTFDEITDKCITFLNKLLFGKISPHISKIILYVQIYIYFSATIILILLFISDCYFNNWVLNNVLLYLPFYMIFKKWYNISKTIKLSHADYDKIIFERYYAEPYILYVNLTQKEEDELNTYINAGFEYLGTDISYLFSSHPIIKKRRFYLTSDEQIAGEYILWYNPTTQDAFRKKDLKTVKNRHFVDNPEENDRTQE